STVTGNVAIEGSGTGGIEVQGTLTLLYSTVVGNTAASPSQAANVSTGDDFEPFASVIALHVNGTGNCSITGSTFSFPFTYSDDKSCGLSQTGDRQGGVAPQLGALGDNGGGTPTMLPSSTSPLLDHVDLADCDFDDVHDDQRFVTRPQGSSCDTGAVERAVSA